LSTLSGGEAQRVKLAARLGREGKAHTLFIFDEPTTGLHLADIEKLLACFARLVARGHSLIVIEHNLEVVKCADWVIDLGPEGGEAGGRLVAVGPPQEIVRVPESHTGRLLAEVLPGPPRVAAAPPGYPPTVATVTEIYHYLRLLFAKLGVQHCTGCGETIRSQTRSQILTRLRRELRGQRVTLLAPVVRGRKGYHKEELAAARKLRLREARIDGRRLTLDRVPLLDRYREHDIDLVVATLPPELTGLDEAVDRALRLGRGTVIALADGRERLYSERLFCPSCGLGFEALDPRLFSFNSRQGACPACNGAGSIVDVDPALILDPARSLAAGALLPLDLPELRAEKRRLLRALAAAGVPLERPVARLSARQRRLVLEGSGELPGALAVLREALGAEEGPGLDEFTTEQPCAACGGQRLNPRARAVRLAGRTIAELTALPVSDAERAIGALRFEGREGAAAEGPL